MRRQRRKWRIGRMLKISKNPVFLPQERFLCHRVSSFPPSYV
nr:MAG TPA: hypothetical protein [Bacteriophage sp.]